MNRKSLTTFFLVAFGLAWILFCIPLTFKNNPETYPTVWQICFMLAMWAPGLGAFFATRLVEKQPIISTLRLNTLGNKRYYFIAWLLPSLNMLVTIVASILLGAGAFDSNFTFMRTSIAQAPTGTNLPPVEVLVLAISAFAMTLAPFINLLFAAGEEIGWRSFMLPRLLHLGQRNAILLSGIIWGVWHAPTTLLYGYNFPQHPYLGVLIGFVGFTLLGTILSWLYLKTRSPWAPGLCHGAFNGVAGLCFYYLQPGFDTALAGSPIGLAGWVSMGLLVAWLVGTKRLPVTGYEKS